MLTYGISPELIVHAYAVHAHAYGAVIRMSRALHYSPLWSTASSIFYLFACPRTSTFSWLDLRVDFSIFTLGQWVAGVAHEVKANLDLDQMTNQLVIGR